MIGEFRANGKPLVIDGKRIYFKDLDSETRSRFSVEYIQRVEDAYHRHLITGDGHDRSNHASGGKQ
ncbi:MAG: hypothetical protein IPQ07_09400 [Myxococcales bacterium]|nr:hypothetical protein [Myxococcales bacterium]